MGSRVWALVVVVQGLSPGGSWALVAPWHVESSWTRDQTCVPCIGRQFPIHCTTREIPEVYDEMVSVQIISLGYKVGC